MKHIIILLSLVCFLTAGCFSSKIIGINTVKAYEGRYDKTIDLQINGEKIVLEDDNVIWILRGETLSVLMSTAANQHVGNFSLIKKK